MNNNNEIFQHHAEQWLEFPDSPKNDLEFPEDVIPRVILPVLERFLNTYSL